MKYKEIPIDDTKGVEQFKVGDWVQVYQYGNCFAFCIKAIEKNILISGQGTCAQWQQCRKTEKVEPREFWLIDKGDPSYNAYNVRQQLLNPKIKQIKVREVLDD